MNRRTKITTILIFSVLFSVLLHIFELYFGSLTVYLVVLLVLCFSFLLLPILLTYNYYYFKNLAKGAPFVRINDAALETVLQYADVKKGQVVADLGSGDGKMLLALASRGAYAYGYEISPLLVFLTRLKVIKHGLTNRITVYKQSFWEADLSEAKTVVLFGIQYIMQDLESKLISELSKGSKVISYKFEFPNLKKVKESNGVTLYEI